MVKLGRSDLAVFPLCLGGNVFGWTADETQSFAVLDAYMAAGGNFIDTADTYSSFAPGLQGGESETVLGKWLQARNNRDRVVLATKVGRMPGLSGLAPDTIRTAIESSLRRLQTDYIDLYWAHADDPETPLHDTLRTFDDLVKEGKVRHIAASNYSAPRLQAALHISDHEGLARFVAVQPQYSLVERGDYEGELSELCVAQELSCVPYWVLARGFLTGKYRPGTAVDSPRAGQAGAYLNERGLRVLAALDQVAGAHGATVAAVALAWAAAQPGVAAPLASARSTEQLEDLLPMAELSLTDSELQQLSDAGATE
jgi:aryl-alcohol dehydrogenase-like predicted oxidoreductase